MRQRLVFVCEQLDQLTRAAELLHRHPLNHWRWVVYGQQVSALQQRGLPLMSELRRRPLARLALQGSFWGVLIGLVMAMLWTVLIDASATLQHTTLLALPICLGSFGGWLGGLLGLTRLDPQLLPLMNDVEQGHCLAIIDAEEVDLRLIRKIMAISGARQRAQSPLGFAWQRVFPALEAEHG